MSRDMTEKQFQAALDKRGWKQEPFLGYVNCSGISISRLNAGDNRREQLRYLILEHRDAVERGLISK